MASPAPDRAVDTWLEAEPKVLLATLRAGARLLHRARASAGLWVSAVIFVAAAMLAWRIRHPPPFKTTMVFRIAERTVGASPETLSSRALRAYIFDLALSRQNLKPLVDRYDPPRPGQRQSLGDPITDLLEAVSLKITENDFIEDRDVGNPPRSVRMELTFQSPQADKSWNVAHELAELIMDSERGRRRRSVAHEEALGEAARRGVPALAAPTARRGGASTSGARPGEPGEHSADRAEANDDVVERDVEAALRESAEAGLVGRSLDAHQALRFELVDPGKYPGDQFQSPLSLVLSSLLALPFLLFAAGLLAGALDPRVLDAEDLTAMGIPLLGRVGPLPRV